ncbi:MAG: hypothetical protein KF760_31520 [Candidatus Eremiobacteraeota bacterium]|nr:hypothetical protein [Candidatus Eremiobacteraeota bacterium]
MKKMTDALALLILLALAGCGGSSSSTSDGGVGSGGPPGYTGLPSGNGATPRVLQWVDKPLGTVNPRGELVQGNVLMPHVSQLGEAVSFLSSASNLVPNDDNNGVDLFVYRRSSNSTIRVNPADTTNLVSYATDYDHFGFAFSTENTDNSPFGPFLTVLGFNGVPPVTGQRGLVTSYMGGVAAYETHAEDDPTGLTRIALTTGDELVGLDNPNNFQPAVLLKYADADCLDPQLEGGYDQRLIFFYSNATNLVPDDTNGVGDIFCYLTRENRVIRVSEGPNGEQFNAESRIGQAADYGRKYVFSSRASNIVAGDTNGASDIFMKDLVSGEVRLISKGRNGQPANGDSDSPSVNLAGDRIIFQSSASNLVPSDTNGRSDIFLYVGLAEAVVGRLSFAQNGEEATGGSGLPSVCALASYGDWVAFTSDATNLLPGVPVGGTHLYLTNMHLQEGNHPYLPE